MARGPVFWARRVHAREVHSAHVYGEPRTTHFALLLKSSLSIFLLGVYCFATLCYGLSIADCYYWVEEHSIWMRGNDAVAWNGGCGEQVLQCNGSLYRGLSMHGGRKQMNCSIQIQGAGPDLLH